MLNNEKVARMQKRIRDIYNDCWKNYKTYLSDYDMDAYNKRSEDLIKKYDCKADIVNLILWFSAKINALHDELKESGNNG